MKINIPMYYELSYPIANKKYYDNKKDNNNLTNLLLKVSDGYCMYCKKRLDSNGELEYNIEHSIEKFNGSEKSFLRNCKFNLSIVCSKCNQKFKTKMIQSIKIDDFDYEICKNKVCSSPCKEIINVQNLYFQKNYIILQPLGRINEKSKNRYEIEYDIIGEIFRESSLYNYSNDESSFILEHIARFGLNRNRFNDYFSDVAVEILEEILDNLNYERIFQKILYKKRDNKIEELFINFLKNNCKDIKSLEKMCRFIIILSYF